MHIALYQPEIPPNTGNIIRLCANAGAQLHLIHPLGFRLDESSVRRAGLDYHWLVNIRQHPHWQDLTASLPDARIFAFTTRGTQRYDQIRYQDDDVLLFGPETRGLPDEILQQVPATQWIRVPMVPASRSVNLSNTVAIALYEAWRQQDFAGAIDPRQ